MEPSGVVVVVVVVVVRGIPLITVFRGRSASLTTYLQAHLVRQELRASKDEANEDPAFEYGPPP